MAPRARITGGESLNSPMRITYEDSSSSENEDPTARPTLKQVLKKPSRLLLRRQSVTKLNNQAPNTPSRSGSSTSRELRTNRSLKFAPSLERFHHHQEQRRPTSAEEFAAYGRESPLMETQQMSNALPELSQPAPKRMLPRANLEAIMLKPLPATPQQEIVNVVRDVAIEPAITALPPMPGSKLNEVVPQPQKRKSSGELVDGDVRSLPKTKSEVIADAKNKKSSSRVTRNGLAETAVMQWIDGVDTGAQRRPEQANAVAGPSNSSTKESSTHADVVLSMLESDRDNIARAAAKLCSQPVKNAPPVPVPERDASARRKRDSSMTATSFTPSIFSRASSWTEHTFLTTPSEQVANDTRTKRGSRDSRDSWRYTRSFASPRSSVMSYSSIPFRSRPFKVDEFGGNSDDPAQSNPDVDLAEKDKSPESDSRSHDTASVGRRSFPASEHLSASFARPLSLSPVEENPEIRVTSVMEVDESIERRDMAIVEEDVKDDKCSVSANTLDMKGTISSIADSVDASGRHNNRCRGAFSPGMPREIFGYHTLDFSASTRLTEENASQSPEKQEEDTDETVRTKIRTLEHRRSVSSDVLSGHQTSPTFAPTIKEEPAATKRKEVTLPNSVSSSEASLSPTESEFGEGSSGITDYTDDDIYLLSDAPGIGRPLQIALANIRRDVVKLVMQELNGISTRAHENNAYGSGSTHAPATLPSSNLQTNGQFGGNNGGQKRPSRDRGNDEQEDREEGDPGKRRKLNTGAIHSSILRSRFACPFYKRNPDKHQRWRSCRGPGWEEVRRVKEHVYRRHMLFTCPRCLQHFEEKSALDDHAQSDTPCTKATTPPPQDIEGCSQEQERKLRCRKRPPGETDEDRWAEMYRILFGDDCDVPGPYYDFDLPTTSPSPSDLPLIEDTFRQLPQRLAADISRKLRRPLDDDERDALPEIIRTSLQAVMPPFWRMFASTPGSDARAAPPASEQGDSAYGSAEHDRESSAPPRGYHGAQMSQTTFSQTQTPNQTPSQHHGANINFQPPPSRDMSFTTQNVDSLYNPSSWPQPNHSYATIPQIPATTSYPQTYHHAPVSVAQHTFMPPATQASSGDPIVHEDFGDLLIPHQFMPESKPQHTESGLRWSIPNSMHDTSGADLPALPLNTIPYSMPTSAAQQPTHHQHMNYHTTNGNMHTHMTPTSTMGPSPNFTQFHINAPQMSMPQQYQPTSSLAYHESNSGAVRTPSSNANNRQSVNLLTTTDQIDSWMWNLNAGGATGGGMQDVFTGGGGSGMNMGGGMMTMGMGHGVKGVGKKRRPEVVEFSRG